MEHNVYRISEQNPSHDYLTISRSIYSGNDTHVTHFSLGKHTDISAEYYPHPTLYFVHTGLFTFTNNSLSRKLHPDEIFLTAANDLCGISADEEGVYTEIQLRKDTIMNEMVKPGEIFALKDLLPYAEGSIVNADIARNEHMKFVVMAFDKGCALSEHAAPGDALIFALDGEGIIGYEGKEYPIKAGENFRFAKGGMHSVKADSRFKMALLLLLD